MKTKFSIAILMLLLTPFAFACDYPARPKAPNGATASKEDMLTGQRAIKEYMATMETYLACIDAEEKEAVAALNDPGEDELKSREAAITKKYNAAVEEMELTAAHFNEQVRAYKEQTQ